MFSSENSRARATDRFAFIFRVRGSAEIFCVPLGWHLCSGNVSVCIYLLRARQRLGLLFAARMIVALEERIVWILPFSFVAVLEPPDSARGFLQCAAWRTAALEKRISPNLSFASVAVLGPSVCSAEESRAGRTNYLAFIFFVRVSDWNFCWCSRICGFISHLQ